MYGLIGRIRTQPGRREELCQILSEIATQMPGCLSYIVAHDPDDQDQIWVTEAWVNREAHENSLSIPAVQEAIGRGRPLIVSMGERYETEPVGGLGLSKTQE